MRPCRENAIHDLGAAFDDRAKLLAVDGSVSMVERWPTSREMFSTGIVASDSTDTKLCRSSRCARSLPTSPGPLQLRQVLLERAMDSGIARIGEQAKRVPEAEGGLQRAGADVQPTRLGIRAPPPRP